MCTSSATVIQIQLYPNKHCYLIIKVKQGQGNKCGTPGVKFQEQAGRCGENKMKQEETEKLEEEKH